jgi:hypothetical protein
LYVSNESGKDSKEEAVVNVHVSHLEIRKVSVPVKMEIFKQRKPLLVGPTLICPV